MTDRTDAQLRDIGEATVVAFGGVGLASRILPATEAYLALSQSDDGARLRPKLDKLLKTATPAGKVYGALLLDRLDPAAGRAAWQRLAKDRSEVTTFSGCIMDKTTLAEYATEHLRSAD
jgi:hypothetical protein